MYCAHLLNIACSAGVGSLVFHHCHNNLYNQGLSFLITAICNAFACSSLKSVNFVQLGIQAHHITCAAYFGHSFVHTHFCNLAFMSHQPLDKAIR
jgi:hypothetical protein